MGNTKRTIRKCEAELAHWSAGLDSRRPRSNHQLRSAQVNPKEQLSRRTALDDLAAAMEEFVEATETRIVNFEKEMHTEAAADRIREVRHFAELRERIDALTNTLRASQDQQYTYLAQGIGNLGNTHATFLNRSL